MARINKVFASGTIANVIFYECNGKPCARSRPARVRQTTATRRAGQRFGLAKTLSRLLRQSFGSLAAPYPGKALMHRVDAGMLPWLRTVQGAGGAIIPLPGFTCATEGGFAEWSRQHLAAVAEGDTLQVTVAAAEQLYNRAGSSGAVLTLAVASLHPQKGLILQSGQQAVAIRWPPVGGEATVLSFPIVLQPGVFVVLSASLAYSHTTGPAPAKAQDPAPLAVVQGWYAGG